MREPVRLWVEALRSGEYEQGQGKLYRTAVMPGSGSKIGACCLGIAAELTPDIFIGENDNNSGSVCKVYGRNWEVNYLPDETMEWLGVVDKDPYVLVTGMTGADTWMNGWTPLSHLNDEWSWNFDQIAAVIEAQADDWNGVRL